MLLTQIQTVLRVAATVAKPEFQHTELEHYPTFKPPVALASPYVDQTESRSLPNDSTNL